LGREVLYMEDQVLVHWIGYGNLAVSAWFVLLAFRSEFQALRGKPKSKASRRLWVPTTTTG
jgi:hypothetical protein